MHFQHVITMLRNRFEDIGRPSSRDGRFVLGILTCYLLLSHWLRCQIFFNGVPGQQCANGEKTQNTWIQWVRRRVYSFSKLKWCAKNGREIKNGVGDRGGGLPRSIRYFDFPADVCFRLVARCRSHGRMGWIRTNLPWFFREMLYDHVTRELSKDESNDVCGRSRYVARNAVATQ